MATITVEIKGYNINRGEAKRPNTLPKDNTHLADNITNHGTTASWADVVAAEGLPAGTESIIVSNFGTESVRVAQSNLAAPAAYHVVLANTQRQIDVQGGPGSAAIRARNA